MEEGVQRAALSARLDGDVGGVGRQLGAEATGVGGDAETASDATDAAAS